MSYIGLAIERRRKQAHMTNKELAIQTGLSQQYVGDVQLGRRIPTLETMLLFATVFPDVQPGRWSWLVLQDLYGEVICERLWEFAVTEEARRVREGEPDRAAAVSRGGGDDG